MPKVYSIDGITPVIDPSAYVHPAAVLIGDVIVSAGCYVGPCASLRGDFGRIILEQGANVQDSCVLHGFPERDTLVERDGHIGHGAILHGCRVKRNAMVGINAVVMDNASIGDSSIIAAAAFVKAGMVVPDRVLVAGVPGKILRELSEQELAWKVEGTYSYQNLAVRSLRTMVLTEPLTEVESDRKRMTLPDIRPLVEMKARQG